MNIWVNGVFDILHTGHLDLLWHAKRIGTIGDPFPDAMAQNRLTVGIDSDERVKRLKGDNRPINNQYERAKMLGNLVMVDSVVIFHDDDELRKYIEILDIDYLVIGDDYRDKAVIGVECTKLGVIYYPKNQKSSSDIIKKIKAL